jgi:hypothetical protein
LFVTENLRRDLIEAAERGIESVTGYDAFGGEGRAALDAILDLLDSRVEEWETLAEKQWLRTGADWPYTLIPALRQPQEGE